jgi:hypothetical protein
MIGKVPMMKASARWRNHVRKQKPAIGAVIGASAGLFGSQRGLSLPLTAFACIGLLVGLALIFSWARELEEENKEEPDKMAMKQ